MGRRGSTAEKEEAFRPIPQEAYSYEGQRGEKMATEGG